MAIPVTHMGIIDPSTATIITAVTTGLVGTIVTITAITATATTIAIVVIGEEVLARLVYADVADTHDGPERVDKRSTFEA